MATISVVGDALRVELTRSERFWGLLRDLTVPLSSITAVEVVTRGLSAPRGIRAPGLGMPWYRYIGTWRRKGDKQYVSVSRNQPALRISLSGQRYDTIVVGVDDPHVVAARLGRPA